ncbi:MAG: hypothetical protein HY699_21035 [Deltaproteobacteria bacterium]|nr:hypothetical protein [Deltaproteobacteria bacterium]
MGTDAIPEDVRRVIAAHIDSVAQLEALLLLRSDPAREWDAGAVAERLYIAASVAMTVLAELSTRGFLTASARPSPRYRYRPEDERLARAADLLDAAYRDQLVEVTNLIHAKSPPAVQRFADAFVVRKEK